MPAAGKGIDEDNTRNIFIEGENLEVLKLLQKSYAGQVKMIYIDPPYNTGNDFVYKDDFKEPLEEYLRRTGQADENGKLLTTNTKAGGRFHSNWLNMLYPRLKLARTLLSDDGFLFVSIDDNEAHNLCPLLDEIFGEENHQTTLYIQVRYPDKTLVEDADFHKLIEMVYVYGKSPSALMNKPESEYSFDKFVWRIVEKSQSVQTITLGGKRVDIFDQHAYQILKDKPSKNALKEIWATGKILDGNSSGRFFRDHLAGRFSDDGYGALYKVYGIGEDNHAYRYFTGPKRVGATKGKYYQGVPKNIFDNPDATYTRQPIANFYNLADSFGNCRHEGGVDFRNGKKPVIFIKTLLKLVSDPNDDDLILDFFAGSCSTAHAVLELNREDCGNRRFFMVQLPEPTDNNEYPTIAEIGKERIRRVIAKMKKERNGKSSSNREAPEDLGFKVFKLARSNFKAWQDYDGENIQELQKLFDQAETPLVKGWKEGDLLTEIMLQQGFPLDSKITPQSGFKSNKVKLIETEACAHRLFVCLDPKIKEDTIKHLELRIEDIFVCLDSALTDQAKMRLSDICKLNII